ncbi:hypothetical protein B0T22DRAFT_441435 [Podospora appendiculata]|uniref:Uncharacterized protein n=1 Tax=Podospora appendiculata TaxID=314037 RepID=A0AAE1CE17_9PEZI|nr:hypothetical protein B0T22DRAFT_441435 [Podospora appendiculata]
MARGKMDEAAAERIRKARGDKDDFARRAAIAARQNKEAEESKNGQKGGSEGGQAGNQGKSKRSWRKEFRGVSQIRYWEETRGRGEIVRTTGTELAFLCLEPFIRTWGNDNSLSDNARSFRAKLNPSAELSDRLLERPQPMASGWEKEGDELEDRLSRFVTFVVPLIPRPCLEDQVVAESAIAGGLDWKPILRHQLLAGTSSEGYRDRDRDRGRARMSTDELHPRAMLGRNSRESFKVCIAWSKVDKGQADANHTQDAGYPRSKQPFKLGGDRHTGMCDIVAHLRKVVERRTGNLHLPTSVPGSGRDRDRDRDVGLAGQTGQEKVEQSTHLISQATTSGACR